LNRGNAACAGEFASLESSILLQTVRARYKTQIHITVMNKSLALAAGPILFVLTALALANPTRAQTNPLPNCAPIGPLTLRWSIDQSNDVIEYELRANVAPDTWMGWGFSASDVAEMAGSTVVLSGYSDDQPFSVSYDLTGRSSRYVNPALPEVELLAASTDGGVTTIRAKRPLGDWPLDGGRAVVWATGPVSGGVDDLTVEYHGTSHALGGSTETIVLGEAQDGC